MRFSTIGRASFLIAALVGCGGSGNGSATTANGVGGSAIPFSASGSPGVFSAGSESGDLLGTFGDAGPFSGMGSPGMFSVPVGGTTDCATVCAKVASVQCVQVDNPPAQGGTGGTNNANTGADNSCEDDCLATFAQLSDCERSLLQAYLDCIVTSTLTCRNGKVQAPSCPEPKSTACGTSDTSSSGTTTNPPTRVVVDGGA
jgi:hypothetical protein